MQKREGTEQAVDVKTLILFQRDTSYFIQISVVTSEIMWTVIIY